MAGSAKKNTTQGKRNGLPRSSAYLAAFFWIFIAALTLWMLNILQNMLLPFVLGLVIAYLLNPFTTRLEKRGVPRALGSVVMIAVFVVLFIGFFFLFVPIVNGQVGNLSGSLPDFAQRLQGYWNTLGLRGLINDTQIRELAEKYGKDFLGMASQFLSSLIIGGMAILNFLSLIFLTPIVTFFLLRDWNEWIHETDKLLPRKHAPTIRRLVSEMDHNLGSFLRGQGLVCLILAVYYSLALTLVGLESGFAIGALAGLLAFIPYLGAAIGGILSIGVALLQFTSWEPVAMVAAIYILGQVAEGNFLSPKIIGEQLGLHPLWIIFALLAGGTLAGFFGVLIALPVLAMAIVLVKYLIGQYKHSSYYTSR